MIGSQITAALTPLRRRAESMMTDTVTIDRITTEWIDGVKQTVVTPIATDVPANLDEPPATTRALVTDETVTPGQPVVKVPVSVAGVEPDDRVTVTAISPTSDPATLGAVLWVTHNRNRTTAVSRRIECRWLR